MTNPMKLLHSSTMENMNNFVSSKQSFNTRRGTDTKRGLKFGGGVLYESNMNSQLSKTGSRITDQRLAQTNLSPQNKSQNKARESNYLDTENSMGASFGQQFGLKISETKGKQDNYRPSTSVNDDPEND